MRTPGLVMLLVAAFATAAPAQETTGTITGTTTDQTGAVLPGVTVAFGALTLVAAVATAERSQVL